MLLPSVNLLIMLNHFIANYCSIQLYRNKVIYYFLLYSILLMHCVAQYSPTLCSRETVESPEPGGSIPHNRWSLPTCIGTFLVAEKKFKKIVTVHTLYRVEIFEHFMGLKTWVKLSLPPNASAGENLIRLKSSAPWSVQKSRLWVYTVSTWI